MRVADLVGFILLAINRVAIGQCEVAQLDPPVATPNVSFGGDVACSGDGSTIVVGAREWGPLGLDSGAAFVYSRQGEMWTLADHLSPDDASGNDFFGTSVDVSQDGEVIAVGANSDDDAATNGGSAYVFRRRGGRWTLEAELFAPDPATSDQFGFSVALSGAGDVLLCGARWDEEFGGGSGAAYVYVHEGGAWRFVQKLTASDPSLEAEFGHSVEMTPDASTFVVGAPYDDFIGSVYTFVRDGGQWTFQAKIQPPDAAVGDYFGRSVAISDEGDLILSGSFHDDDGAVNAGSAYLFHRSDSMWTMDAKLLASDGVSNDEFGLPLDLSGDGEIAVIHAKAKYIPFAGCSVGAAYAFRRVDAHWVQVSKIRAMDTNCHDLFGEGLDLIEPGDLVCAGAPGATNPLAAFGGRVYVLPVREACSGDLDGDGHVNGFDLAALLGEWIGFPFFPVDCRLTAQCTADINGDGTTNGLDLALLLGGWN